MLGNMCRESTLISIHAPPRGATNLMANTPPFDYISIHAPPRGATKPASSSNALANHFNSRPSARGDRVRTFVFVAGNISIHAPPRGATDDGTRVLKSYLFQFTPLREGRLCEREETAAGKISIHAPPRGAT